MKTKRFLTWALFAGLALIIAALPLGACGGPSAKPGQDLKVGMMTPSTGPAAEKGAPGGHGVIDAMEYINKELGGAGGYPIKLMWRDSGYNMATIPTIVKSYMDEGALLFTTHASAEMTAAMETANRAEFPGMATYTAPNLYRPPRHIYGQMPDYGDDWVTFATYYMKNIWKGTGKPKMVLHLLNNSTGYGARDGARAMADKLGIELLQPFYEHKTTDISMMETMTKIKAQKPDVLFISSTPAPTAIILKNAYELGMTSKDITIGLAHASFTKALIDLATPQVAEGVYGVFPTVTWDDNAPGIAKAAEYLKKNNPSDANNMDYLSTWSTALIVREILTLTVKNAGYDVLAKGGVDAWRAIETKGIQKLNGYKVEGLHGPVTYTPGDNRLDKYVKMYKISGGKITAISDWIEAPAVKYEEFSWWGK